LKGVGICLAKPIGDALLILSLWRKANAFKRRAWRTVIVN